MNGLNTYLQGMVHTGIDLKEGFLFRKGKQGATGLEAHVTQDVAYDHDDHYDYYYNQVNKGQWGLRHM